MFGAADDPLRPKYGRQLIHKPEIIWSAADTSAFPQTPSSCFLLSHITADGCGGLGLNTGELPSGFYVTAAAASHVAALRVSHCAAAAGWTPDRDRHRPGRSNAAAAPYRPHTANIHWARHRRFTETQTTTRRPDSLKSEDSIVANSLIPVMDDVEHWWMTVFIIDEHCVTGESSFTRRQSL